MREEERKVGTYILAVGLREEEGRGKEAAKEKEGRESKRKERDGKNENERKGRTGKRERMSIQRVVERGTVAVNDGREEKVEG